MLEMTLCEEAFNLYGAIKKNEYQETIKVCETSKQCP